MKYLLFALTILFGNSFHTSGQHNTIELGNGFYFLSQQAGHAIMFLPSYKDTFTYYFSENKENSSDTSGSAKIPKVTWVVIPDVTAFGFNKDYVLATSKGKTGNSYWIIDKTKEANESGSEKYDERIPLSNVRITNFTRFESMQKELNIPVHNIYFYSNSSGYSQSTGLYETVLKLDSTFFNAYNNCDLAKQEEFYSDSIEFFHDKTGLETSKKKILEDTKKYICGKVTRELVKGSVEVSPLPGYGAVELGSHLFRNNQEKNDTPHASKFVIVWRNNNGKWTITKVISLH
jgi:hypothetical protein